MKSQQPNNQEQLPGSKLVDTLAIPESRRDLIFAYMILTAIGVFIGGNALLLMNTQVLSYSWRIAAISLGVMFVFYTISRITSNLIWGLVSTYGLLLGLVYAGSQPVKLIIYGMMISALFYTTKHLRVNREHWASLILMAMIGVSTILGVHGSYSSFDIIPRLHAGMLHQDTLFHASIAAMFKNYGSISTGLNGLIEIPYHVFSHILMAAISILSGCSVLEVYGVAPFVLFSPLLIFAVTASSAMLDRNERLSLPIAWGLTALLLSILPWLFSPWALWDSFFVSESYLVALGIFSLGLGLLFKKSLSFSDLLLILILALLISSAKATVGIIFGGLWITRLLFISTRRYLDASAAILASFGATWMVLSAIKGSSSSIYISPFDFISYSYMGGFFLDFTKKLVEGGDFQLTLMLGAMLSIGSFWLLHFGISWIVIARSIQESGIRALLRSPVSAYSFAAIGAGSLIVILYRIPGGSAYYFTNVAFFVSLPSLIGFTALKLQQLFKKSIPHTFFVFSLLLSGWLNAGAFLEMSQLGKARIYDGKNSELINKLDIIRESSPINEVQRASIDLIKINPVSSCSAQPFVFSAVSERAWVDLLKADDASCLYEYYGYDQYFIPSNGHTALAPARLINDMWIKSQPDGDIK